MPFPPSAHQAEIALPAGPNGTALPGRPLEAHIVLPAALGVGRLLPWWRRNVQPGPNEFAKDAALGIRPSETIAAGESHTLCLHPDGTLWAAGWNHLGQLGDGTTHDRTTPVCVATGVMAVSAGASHSVFVRTDGTLWATGYNFYGQLGDGTTANRCQPRLVTHDVTAVVTGWWHTAFLRADGTAWTMGYNYYGQLGQGAPDCRAHPVPQPAGGNVVAIAAGPFHTVFRQVDNSTRVVGRIEDGQAVDGTARHHTTPGPAGPGVARAVGREVGSPIPP